MIDWALKVTIYSHGQNASLNASSTLQSWTTTTITMPSLSDFTDILAQHARAIRSTAAATAKYPPHTSSGPFTSAVLQTPLGDLIRDADSSELGLFTLVSPHSHPGSGPHPDPKSTHPDIARAEFLGATPLRKPAPRRDEPLKAKDPDPEVYAQAALKYLDR